MTDEQIIAAVRAAREARLVFVAAVAHEERTNEDNSHRLLRAADAVAVARIAYETSMLVLRGVWSPEDKPIVTAPTTPEQSGKKDQPPPMDIHDVLASGVIPGAPVVDPILADPRT